MQKISFMSASGYSVRIAYEAKLQPLFHQVAEFLGPHFSLLNDSAHVLDADLFLELRPSSEFPGEARSCCAVPTPIRVSTSPNFNLSALTGGWGGKFVAWDAAGDTGYVIDRASNAISLYAGDNAFFHLIELIRYFGLLVLDRTGRVILHSSAVLDYDSDSIIAIVGDKGAGKTSTLLSMIATGRYGFVTGDKLIVSMGESGLLSAGWPDYPHVGLAGLLHVPDIHDRLKSYLDTAESTPNTDKLLIDPLSFRDVLPVVVGSSKPLSKIIFPNVSLVKPLSKQGVEEKKGDSLLRFFEKPESFISARWHGIEANEGEGASCQSRALIVSELSNLIWENWEGR